MDLGLGGRTAIVTGASRGIGRETARQLCAEGARVLLVSRDENALASVAEECGSLTGEVALLACDVTDTEAGRAMATAAERSFGAAEILVNNAGAARWRDLEAVPDADWQIAWNLNVMACMRAMRAVIPSMRSRRWGRIVNVSSTAGKRPSAQMPEYSVAKAAQLSLSRLFADRYASDGVLVNAICPGPTKSGLWTDVGGLADQSAAAAGLSGREQAIEVTGAKRPIGRLAEVGEIASAIVFLCSERASYVSGAAWSVDGGTVPVII